mgnify:CR=1 FL=1
MINLLPPAYTDKILYGRKNGALMKWLVWVGIANLGLLLLLFFGWVYIDRQSDNITSQIDFAQKQLKIQNLDEVEKESKQITNNVRTINQILGREVLFSRLIQEVGKIIPSGAVLGSISLTQVSGSIDVLVNSRDNNSAVQAAANLSDPKNNLFEKVDIVNINCTGSTPDYPCTSTFKALFSNISVVIKIIWLIYK